MSEMDPHKRRKLESRSSPGPRVSAVSAFAARQTLLSQQTVTADVTVQETLTTETGRPGRPKSPRKTKRKVVQALAGVDEVPLAVASLVPAGFGASHSAPSTPVLASTPASPHPETRAFRADRNYQHNADDREKLRAAEGKRIVILGSYGVQVYKGEITIGGAVLTESKRIHWVHAPHCHALPVIRVVQDSIIELHPHPAARCLRQLSRLNPAFGRLWNEDYPEEVTSTKADQVAPTFQILVTSQDGPRRATIQELKVPAEWNKKLDGLVAATQKTTQVVFLCGPKSSGKSTFGRLLTNRLVTDHGGVKKKPWSTVSVLDLDPGQPEYGPPGVVSLNRLSAPVLSPPFCHPFDDGPNHAQPRAHAIAAISPAQDPAHFIECALDLFSHYRQSTPAGSPLVINTPGWIQGTGLDILADLIQNIGPTEVIYMSQDGPDETVERLKSACSSPSATFTSTFTTLPSQPSENAPRTPMNLRTLQTMSYFHLDSRQEAQHQTWNPTQLSEMRPWRVRYTGSDKGFVGVLCYDYQPALNLLRESINGMILALVRIENDAAFRDLLGSPPLVVNVARTEEGIPVLPNPLGRTLDPRHSRALGLVLVRGVDTERGELQLLTPLPVADIVAAAGEGASNLVLVAGKFDTPNWAYAEGLYWALSANSDRPAGDNRGLGADEGESESEDDEDDIEDASAKGPLSRGLETRKANDATTHSAPWVELHHGSQKRSVGSRWRVRRDLGRA
ncbi:hypothetical protein QBC37DRAFT_412332 [Rhypophila decipiens]|uniref:Polynucleotide 5'-hydroxyl-kinase GRC3 n=1 Tax=Rhypophila decipiens TaxID=261697 RepID=A0AAN7BA75_9PEZI|nr:hypothetical protein QBC37DRAFT_412332 [Rhypophila decipiens]